MLFKRLFRVLSSSILKILSIGSTFRIRMLSNVGRNALVVFPASLNIKGVFQVGDDFFSGPHLYISSNVYSVISIGNGVMLGPFVSILSGNHIMTDKKSHMRYLKQDDPGTLPIVLEDGAWIASSVTILSGAKISEGAVIAAKSLVTGYVPPYSIAMGAPCNRYISRFSVVQLKEVLKNTSSSYNIEDIIRIYKECKVEVKDG